MASYIVGVAGGTGSGKSTVAHRIVEALASDHAAIIPHDNYYRDRSELAYEERCELNFDHPESLETELLVAHVRELRAGRAIEMPGYDFATHRRKQEAIRVEPQRVLVVEGILVFVEPELRALFDLKIFVDTDADIRVFRRVRRDIEQRGRSFQSVREQYYKTVRPMHLQFVEPSKRWADVIIPEGGENLVALDLILAKLRNVAAGDR